MPSKQYRAVCWTIFNEAIPTYKVPALPHYVRYSVYQVERCKTGRLHYQGYFELSERATDFKLHADFHPTAHFEERRGTRDQARHYCMDREKPGVVLEIPPVEYGKWIKGSGHRTDLELACEHLRDRGSIAEVAELFPETYVKFHKGLLSLEAQLDKPEPDMGFVPRPWQQKVLDNFPVLRNERKIGWCWDTHGNVGKSRFANHLVRQHGAILLSGKVADMSYMYKKHPIAIMDVPRTGAENVDHLFGFAEQLKNGMVVSTKYESTMKVFKPPIVLFFANFPCPSGKWSADRLVEFNLNDLI